MDVTLPTDLRAQMEQELACGRYTSSDDIGHAVDQAGLYERVLAPREE